MSLRLRLIALIAVVLAASLAAGGGVASLNASRSVQTEMDSAQSVAGQIVVNGIALLESAADPEAGLEHLIAAFKGNRHIRVYLTGETQAVAAPPNEAAMLGEVPAWFVRLLGVSAGRTRIPVTIGGRDYGAVVIETDPHNEILEIWDKFADALLVLALFSGATMILVYFFIGRALRPLERMAGALSRIGAGDYGVRLTGRLPPELSKLRDSFNRMAGQLAEMDAENRRLNEQLLTLQEQERGDIARDLHDEIGPFLFAINVDAANIARQIEEGRPDSIRSIKSQVASIGEAVGHMQKQVRAMLGRLRPIGLAEFGLAEAIGNLIGFWHRRYPGIDYRVDIAPEIDGFGEVIDPAIYRIVQECLSNAVRHGRPGTITVSVRHAGKAGSEDVIVRVCDDGRGMTGGEAPGFGLLGMSERVKAMGGTLEIASEPGAGMTVTAVIPLAPAPRLARLEEVGAP